MTNDFCIDKKDKKTKRGQKGGHASQIEPVQLLQAGAFYKSCVKWFDGNIKEIEILFFNYY